MTESARGRWLFGVKNLLRWGSNYWPLEYKANALTTPPPWSALLCVSTWYKLLCKIATKLCNSKIQAISMQFLQIYMYAFKRQSTLLDVSTVCFGLHFADLIYQQQYRLYWSPHCIVNVVDTYSYCIHQTFSMYGGSLALRGFIHKRTFINQF